MRRLFRQLSRTIAHGTTDSQPFAEAGHPLPTLPTSDTLGDDNPPGQQTP